jgi:hypothetical protein
MIILFYCVIERIFNQTFNRVRLGYNAFILRWSRQDTSASITMAEVRFSAKAKYFSLLKTVSIDSGTHHTRIQWVLVALSPGSKAAGSRS